ncbi:MAG: GNAT family N-acetyltransferase [Desulfobacteraceae bacterium]|nr:GNAT family N-acetyltransferase [Desulfobacteraceae bacterium]
MITQIEKIEEILPIFKEYLGYMSQFYKIYDLPAWCEGALKNLEQYSRADDSFIYILKKSDSIIGFALINKHLRFNHDGFAIAEFYIQKDHGRTGCGRLLAEYVFSRFPGNWEVAVTLKNRSALSFWKQVVSVYTSDIFIKKKKASFDGYAFLFNNRHGRTRDFTLGSAHNKD